MICLTDNDAILKLATWNLLEEAIAVLDTTREEVFVLPAAHHKIRRDSRGELAAKHGAEGIGRALAFIDSVQKLTQGIDPEEQALFSTVNGIDEGEALLFGATQDKDVFVVATGDKRSLKALADAPNCSLIYQRMSGRVICLEQIIARLVPYIGFNEVRSRVVPLRDCDKSIKSAFGSGLLAEERNVQRSLVNRIAELRSEVGTLLVPDNEWITGA